MMGPGRFHFQRIIGAAGAVLALCAGAGTAWAQVGSDGIDWATIGNPGNQPWTGDSDPLSPTFGRGSVAQTYSMSRTEITTATWLELYNAALARPDPLPFANLRWWRTPALWGATRDTTYTGPGVRYRLRTDVADAGMLPVGGISWRTGAVLCNWLNSGKSSLASAFTNGGSYDVSTFTPEISFPTFDDQRRRSPGAHYWIPDLDEYLKAAFYDPNRNGPGQGGWWTQPNGTDTPLIYGPPPSFGGNGTGQANTGFTLPGRAELNIPLGAYPSVQSPWGLLDLAGGTSEWIEDFWVSEDGQQFRLLDGSHRSFGTGGYIDSILSYGQESPWIAGDYGIRLASDVPTPGVGFMIAAGSCVLYGRRERRRFQDEESSLYHGRRCRVR